MIEPSSASSPQSSYSRPLRASLAALALLSLGFVVGYGFHTTQSVSQPRVGSTAVRPSPTPSQATPVSTGASPATTVAPPVVKGLHVSPDSRRVAFTGVYNNGQRASRFIFDLRSGGIDIRDTPIGWQDFIVQWSSDGRRILFDRERIPRAVAEATPGLHEERFEYSNEKMTALAPRSLTPRGVLPAGEKSFSGLWASDGELIVKTRREPKSVFQVRNGRARILDQTNGSYLQNRPVREGNKSVLYVVRDLPDAKGDALFRIENGSARRISEVLENVEWAYVAESGRWMVICRAQLSSEDWVWTLYRISPKRAQAITSRNVPADVISVFWSPDEKAILGASGNSLWTIDVPSLTVKRVGQRSDWDADDAGWITGQNAIVVASRGVLWRVDIASGKSRPLWKFPPRYWRVS